MRTENKNVPRKMSTSCINALVDEGFTQSQIARTCNVSRQAVHQRMPGYSDKRSHRQERKRRYKRTRTLIIGHMHRQGVRAKEIGMLFSISIWSVNYYIRKYKLGRR